MPKIVTPDRITLPMLQRMRDEFSNDGDEVGYYVIDYLVMKYLELDAGRAPYIERLMAACAREIAPEEVA